MLIEIRADALRYEPDCVSLPRLLVAFLRHPGFRATVLYRIGHAAHLRGRRTLARAATYLSRMTSGCEINVRAVISEGFHMPHPHGVIVGSAVVIGPGCTVQQHVTLGGNYGKHEDGREKPILGSGVLVSAGAVIAGPVVVGQKAQIGANAVVTFDVPPRAIVAPSKSMVIGVRSD